MSDDKQIPDLEQVEKLIDDAFAVGSVFLFFNDSSV